jgi:hypothetical protein
MVVEMCRGFLKPHFFSASEGHNARHKSALKEWDTVAPGGESLGLQKKLHD